MDCLYFWDRRICPVLGSSSFLFEIHFAPSRKMIQEGKQGGGGNSAALRASPLTFGRSKMKSSDLSHHEMTQDLEILLDRLCVDLGFCLPPKEKKRILGIGRFDATTFSREVLISESMQPEENEKFRRQIMRCFTDRYGNSNH